MRFKFFSLLNISLLFVIVLITRPVLANSNYGLPKHKYNLNLGLTSSDMWVIGFQPSESFLGMALSSSYDYRALKNIYFGLELGYNNFFVVKNKTTRFDIIDLSATTEDFINNNLSIRFKVGSARVLSGKNPDIFGELVYLPYLGTSIQYYFNNNLSASLAVNNYGILVAGMFTTELKIGYTFPF